ncbi:uncharacterized protein [Typha angustifolia]|uniref:uncharacterized protein n=1 Tax=Typha angustifolia TaxID=59011 RepID=UPI003C2B4CAF
MHSIRVDCNGVLRVYFKCEKIGHISSHYQTPSGGSLAPQNQQYQTQGSTANLGPQSNRLPPTSEHQKSLVNSGASKPRPRAQGRVYALTQEDAEYSPTVVQGTLCISSMPAKVLIDSGATHSFATPAFINRLLIMPEVMDTSRVISTRVVSTICLNHVCKSCMVELEGKCLPVDLISLGMNDFDVILGMDYLAAHHATVDSSVVDMQNSTPSIEDLSILTDFCDIFPEDLPGLPPDREIEFTIDFTPSIAPISKAPYKMALAELTQL